MTGPLETNPAVVPVPVMGVANHPTIEVILAAEAFSQEGHPPLLVDRIILAVLILIIALIVRKLA